MHPTVPLLISSSKDGTIRMWRLDTFELVRKRKKQIMKRVFLKEIEDKTEHTHKTWPNLIESFCFYHLPVTSNNTSHCTLAGNLSLLSNHCVF